jgi:hypothetical protein
MASQTEHKILNLNEEFAGSVLNKHKEAVILNHKLSLQSKVVECDMELAHKKYEIEQAKKGDEVAEKN